MPKAPVVDPENHEEIYDYYAHEAETSEGLIKFMSKVAGSVIYQPQVRFADGAEEAIAERLDEGDKSIVASNHLNITDQFPIFALAEQARVLKPLEGRMFALAKAEYFTSGYIGQAMRNKVVDITGSIPVISYEPDAVLPDPESPTAVDAAFRKLLDITGTMPVFRTQDIDSDMRLQVRAARSLIDAATARLANNWHMLVFPEGTRNKGDPTKLGRIQGGIGRIATLASEQVGIIILPLALWYGAEQDQRLRSPNIYINNPIVGPFQSKGEVLHLLRPAMQESLAQAIELSRVS